MLNENENWKIVKILDEKEKRNVKLSEFNQKLMIIKKYNGAQNFKNFSKSFEPNVTELKEALDLKKP